VARLKTPCATRQLGTCSTGGMLGLGYTAHQVRKQVVPVTQQLPLNHGSVSSCVLAEAHIRGGKWQHAA
jgi:hypothetical protein